MSLSLSLTQHIYRHGPCTDSAACNDPKRSSNLCRVGDFGQGRLELMPTSGLARPADQRGARRRSAVPGKPAYVLDCDCCRDSGHRRDQDARTVFKYGDLPLSQLWPHMVLGLLLARRDAPPVNRYLDELWRLVNRLDDPGISGARCGRARQSAGSPSIPIHGSTRSWSPIGDPDLAGHSGNVLRHCVDGRDGCRGRASSGSTFR